MFKKFSNSITSIISHLKPNFVIENRENKDNVNVAAEVQETHADVPKSKPIIGISDSRVVNEYFKKHPSIEILSANKIANIQYCNAHGIAEPSVAQVINPHETHGSNVETNSHNLNRTNSINDNGIDSSSISSTSSDGSVPSDASDSSEGSEVSNNDTKSESDSESESNIGLADTLSRLNELSSKDHLMQSERVHRISYALSSTEGHEIEKSILLVKELEAFSTQGQKESTDETLARVKWKHKLVELVDEYTCGGFDSKVGQEAEEVLQTMAKVMGNPIDWIAPLKRILENNNISVTEKSSLLQAELRTISKQGNNETNKEMLARIDWQTQLVALIDEYTNGADKSKLGKQAEDVLVTLAEVMGNLHAGKLGDSWHYKEIYFSADKLSEEWENFKKRGKFHPAIRSPQMDAHKILKRHREALIAPNKTNKHLSISSSPDAAVEFVGKVWEEEGTIKTLSKSRRSLTDKDVIKTGTAIAITGALLATSHFVGEAVAASNLIPFHFDMPIDLQNAHQNVTELQQQYSDQAQNIAQLQNDANTTLASIKPGSSQCEALWEPLHPDGKHTPQLFSVDDWQTTSQQLDSINLKELHGSTKRFVIHLQEQAHNIVNATQAQEATGAALQAAQDQLPTLEHAAQIAEANLAQQHHKLVSNVTMGVTEIAAEVIGTGVAAASAHRYAMGKASQAELPQNDATKTQNPKWNWRKGISDAAEFKKNYIGKIGVIGMTVGAGKFLFGDAGSSPQHAEIRDSIAALIESREVTSADNQEAILPKLGASWANMMAALSYDIMPNKDDLPLNDQVNILNACIKELDPLNFDPKHRETVNTLRKDAMRSAPEGALRALLPKLDKHITSYIWLALHLLSDDTKSSDRLTSTEIENIKDTLENFSTSFGAVGRLQNKLNFKAQILKAEKHAANYRPDMGIIGGSEGKKRRINAIENRNTEQKAYLDKKQAKLENAIKDLQEFTHKPRFQVDRRSMKSIADKLASRIMQSKDDTITGATMNKSSSKDMRSSINSKPPSPTNGTIRRSMYLVKNDDTGLYEDTAGLFRGERAFMPVNEWSEYSTSDNENSQEADSISQSMNQAIDPIVDSIYSNRSLNDSQETFGTTENKIIDMYAMGSGNNLSSEDLSVPINSNNSNPPINQSGITTIHTTIGGRPVTTTIFHDSDSE